MSAAESLPVYVRPRRAVGKVRLWAIKLGSLRPRAMHAYLRRPDVTLESDVSDTAVDGIVTTCFNKSYLGERIHRILTDRE